MNFSFVDSVLDVNVKLMFQSSQCVSCGVLCAVRVKKTDSVGTKQKVQNCPYCDKLKVKQVFSQLTESQYSSEIKSFLCPYSGLPGKFVSFPPLCFHRNVEWLP
jgi:hypothetical protein